MSWRDLIKQVSREVYPVEHDDHGDPSWKYHAVYKLDGEELWSDYWLDEPDDAKLYDVLLEAFYNDHFTLGGKVYSEWEQRR